MNLFEIANLLNLRTSRKITGEKGFFYCPFHPEKEESLSISVDKNAWHCFSCGRGGSLSNLSYRLIGKNIFSTNAFALNYITTVTNNKEKNNYKEKVEINYKEEEEKVQLIVNGVMTKIDNNSIAYQYLIEKRGLQESIIKNFNIKYMEYGEINNKVIFNRIVFPIYGTTEKIVNYECRDITGTQKPKVIYPPNSMKSLLNYNNLKNTETIVIFEGSMDAFFYAPISNNVTALLGADISPYQIYQFKLLEPRKIMFAFDNDEAGRKAEVKLYKKLKALIEKKELPEIFFSKLVLPENYKDLNELWQKDRITIQTAFEKNLIKQIRYDFSLNR